MRNVLFVSPHLDDAVFSCASRIMHEARQGARVAVATVFSHGSHEDHICRRKEDEQALRLLGAQPFWLGLLDAPYRNPFYNSFRRIIFQTAAGDREQVSSIRKALRPLVEELAPDLIFLPLGVGGHIDHRLTFAAGTFLRDSWDIRYYEEQPYSMVHHAVAARLKEIGGVGTRRAMVFGAFLKSFRSAAYVRQYLPPGSERRWCEQRLRRKFARTPTPKWKVESEITASALKDRQRLVKALYSYASQAPIFLGKRSEHLESLRIHARRLGAQSWRAERFWRLEPISRAERGRSVSARL